jgi:uncharacterized protein YaeQ
MKDVSKEMEGRGMAFKVRVAKGALWCMDTAGRIRLKLIAKMT